MFRKYILGHRILYCAYIPGLTNSLDEPKPLKIDPKNGYERVMTLFEQDQYGELNKNLVAVQQISVGSGFCLGMYGGFRYAKLAFDNFIEANQLTRFKTPYEAKRLMSDHVAVEFGRHFLIYAFKGFVFSALLMSTIVVVSLYRDKEGIIEYTLGGIVAGGLSRIHYGLKGMCGGAFAASGLSTIVGVIVFTFSKLQNFSMQDLRDWQYSLKVWRKEKIKDVIEHSRDDEISIRLRDYVKVLPNNDPEENEKVFVLLDAHKKSPVRDDTASESASSSTADLSKTSSSEK